MDWAKMLSGLANIVGTISRKVHDDSQKKNAGNASEAGLEVRVSRTYDDVGLSGRRDCQFCLDRECTNVTLDEAYEIGAFQRHPGCGCEITYTTEKGTKVQTDWHSNTWDDVQERVNYGLDDFDITPQMRIAQLPQNINVTAEYIREATPGEGVISIEPGYNSKSHKEENDFAVWLHKTFGGTIVHNKDSETKDFHFADFTWNQRLWELKTISSSKYNTIDQHIRDANKQIATNRGGFFIDISKSQIDIEKMSEMIEKSMKLRGLPQTDVLIKNGDLFEIRRIR